MTNILILLLLNSLYIFGLYKVVWYNVVVENDAENFKLPPTVRNRELLWFIAFYGKKWFGYEFMKPICLCPSCMSSVHGSLFFLIAIITKFVVCATVIHIIVLWAVYILALCGLNYIVSRWI